MAKILALLLVALFLFSSASADDDFGDQNEREIETQAEAGESIDFLSYDPALGNTIRFYAEQNSEGIYVQVEFTSAETSSHDEDQSDEDSNEEDNEGEDDSGSDDDGHEDENDNEGNDQNEDGNDEGSDEENNNEGEDEPGDSNDPSNEDENPQEGGNDQNEDEDDEDNNGEGNQANGGNGQNHESNHSENKRDEDEGNEEGEGEDDAGDEDEPEFVVRFSALFETITAYTETNGEAGYQAGEDAEETIYSLSEVNFTGFNCSATTIDGVGAHICTVSSDLFSVSIYLVEAPVTVSGVDIDPTSTKLDVFINKEDSRNIALIVGFHGEDNEQEQVEPEIAEDDKKQTTDERELSFGDHGYFSWVLTASINNVTVDVINSDVTSDEHDGLNEITFSFETEEVGELYWDPVLAVKGTSLLTGGAGIVIPCFAGIIIAALAFIL